MACSLDFRVNYLVSVGEIRSSMSAHGMYVSLLQEQMQRLEPYQCQTIDAELTRYIR